MHKSPMRLLILGKNPFNSSGITDSHGHWGLGSFRLTRPYSGKPFVARGPRGAGGRGKRDEGGCGGCTGRLAAISNDNSIFQ